MAHLLVEVVLYVAYVVYFRGVCGHNLVEHGLRVACVVAPAEEVGSAVLVAESAESCVGEQPVAVALHKSLEVGAVECRFAVLNENLACVFVFGFVHALVVYFLESVQLACEFVVVLAAALVFECTQLGYAQVHGVQGKGGVGVVGVRVDPCVGHGGVVDRQELEECLLCGGSPVYHAEQVVEVAHAHVVVAAESEYGNCRACAAPGCESVDEAHACQHSGLSLGGSDAYAAILATFPSNDFARVLVEDEVFVFGIGINFGGGNVCAPYRKRSIAHAQSLARIPVAKSL